MDRSREPIPVRGEDRDIEAAPVRRQEGVDDVVQQTTNVITPRDRIRWGPIWGGLLMALATFLLLSTLALAIGAMVVEPNTIDPEAAGTTGGIVSAIIILIAFLVGGWVAARASAVHGHSNGLLNGVLVWALGMGLVLLLSVLGLGSLFGALGGLLDQIRLASVPRPDVNVNPAEVTSAIRNSALGAFLTLLLPALAAAAGGWLGARKDDGRHAESR